MNKWQSFRALKRVIVEIEALSNVLSTSLEAVISTPADEKKPLQELRSPVAGFTSVSGILELLELPELALLAREIRILLSALLEENKVLPDWKINPQLESAYVGLGKLCAMLEAGIENNSDDFEQIVTLVNRLRNSRNVAQVFSSSVLLEKQHINYKKVFTEKPQLLQDLMEKQLMSYNKACKILLKNSADRKALEVVAMVADNLQLVLRDYRAGTRWGLASTLLATLPEEQLNQSLFRILAGFSWSLQFSNNDSVMLAHEEMSGVLDKDLENSILDDIAKLPEILGNATPQMELIRQWISRTINESHLSTGKYFTDEALTIDDVVRIHYHGRDARKKTLLILIEQISVLLDTINQIADSSDISRGATSQVQLEIRQIEDIVHFLGLKTLAKNIENELAAASTSESRVLLFTMARILINTSTGLSNYQDNDAANLFFSLQPVDSFPVMSSARLHALQETITTIESVIRSLDLLAVNNTDVDDEIWSTLGQLSQVLHLMDLHEQSEQFQIAQDYIFHLKDNAVIQANSDGFQSLCQLMINSLWYFQQLVLGQEADCAIYLEKSAGFARQLLADISRRTPSIDTQADVAHADIEDSKDQDTIETLSDTNQASVPLLSPRQLAQPGVSGSQHSRYGTDTEIDEGHKHRMLFSNEFDEILLALREQLGDLQSKEQQTSKVRTCCRLFHTLGGSGRSVAEDIAAVSVAMEKLFDSLSANPRGITDEIMKFTEVVLDVLALLRDGILDPDNDNAFKAGSFNASINNICMQAQAFQQALNGNSSALEIQGEYPGITQTKTALQKQIQSDDPLLTGFLHESRELLARVQEGHQAQIINSNSLKALEQISAALYLLQGAAEIAEQPSIGTVVCKLVETIEKLSPQVVAQNGVDETFIDIVAECVDWLGNAMSRLEDGHSQENSETLLAAMEEYLPGFPEVISLGQISNPVRNALFEPPATNGKTSGFEATSTFNDSEELLFLPAPEVPAPRQEQPDTLISTPSSSDTLEIPVDQELLAVFLDEMTELLQDLDDLYLHWQENPEDKTILENYLRILHTLKGSSALAQENDLSNAAHEYESFVINASKSNGFNKQFFTTCDIHLHGLHKICDLYSKDANGHITRKTFTPEISTELVTESSTETATVPIDSPASEDLSKKNTALQATAVAQIPDSEKGDGKLLTSVRIDTGVGAPLDSQKEEDGISISAPAFNFQSEPGDKVGDSQHLSETAPPQAAAEEQVRVSSQLLGYLLNDADEINFSRNRLEKNFHDIGNLLIEMDETLIRLNSFVKRVDENASQTLITGVTGTNNAEGDSAVDEFDVLEMDRYTELQEMSLSLTEDYEDLQDIRRNLSGRLKEIDQALMGQQRLTNSLQDGLISSQMLPFSSIVPRLRRLVRQTGRELKKEVRIEVQNQQGNLDKNILQAVITPFEHILRNAIDHGIEPPGERAKAGKEEQAVITVMVARQGASISVAIRDDGRGIDVEKVKSRAVETGLLEEGAIISDEEAMQLIFQAGFSTADKVSTISGRGVGLDVVKNQINQVGGSVEVVSETGKGTVFMMTLPLTSSLNRALLFRIQETPYVVLMDTLDGVLVEKLARIYQREGNAVAPVFEYGSEQYEYMYLGKLIDPGLDPRPESVDAAITLLLVKGKQKNVALHIDSIIESRDLVVKSFGKQFTSMPGISGGVIMPDGNVAIVLDLVSLVNLHHENKKPAVGAMFLQSGTRTSGGRNKKIMVVDDSITVRKVTTGILERNGMEVLTAKNGLEAIALLENQIPDVILLDIEMPKMDGFEVATYIRKQPSPIRDIPIIMITSRIGEKHRNRAGELGVNEYLCKPFQEKNLIETIQNF